MCNRHCRNCKNNSYICVTLSMTTSPTHYTPSIQEFHVGFEYDRQYTACIPFTTRFTSTTNVQPDSVKWDFGNGTTANTSTALATYSTVGSYPVTYSIWVHGQRFNMRVPHYITAKYCDCCNPNIKH